MGLIGDAKTFICCKATIKNINTNVILAFFYVVASSPNLSTNYLKIKIIYPTII